MPKVSVIVPVYNVEKYLNRCVDSILAQTMTDFELLLVDDGSTDGSGAICDTYATQDSRVRVFHKENGGVSSARNMGLDEATGEYIAFVDSDDWVSPVYLEKLSASECDLSVCGFRKSYPDGSQVEVIPSETGKRPMTPVNFNRWYRQAFLNVSTGKAFKRDIIRQNFISFDTSISYGEDTLFVVDFIPHCNSIAFIAEANYTYFRQNSGTLSTTLSEAAARSLDLCDMRLQERLSRYNYYLELFNTAAFPTKSLLKGMFMMIYESADTPFASKYTWYNTFFDLPTFANNIDILFADYPKKLRAVLHTKSALAVIAFQWLAALKSKVMPK